jgi:hypothetical protein
MRKTRKWEPIHLYTFKRYENGVYCRDAEMEFNTAIKFRLADVILLDGILRVDELSGSEETEVRLGHYALPQLTSPVKEENRTIQGNAVRIINNGTYQLAMVTLKGWTGMEFVRSKGLNPVAEHSEVINATDTYTPGATHKKFYITLLLWEKSGEKWSDKELMPVKKVTEQNGAISIVLTNGAVKVIDYK